MFPAVVNALLHTFHYSLKKLYTYIVIHYFSVFQYFVSSLVFSWYIVIYFWDHITHPLNTVIVFHKMCYNKNQSLFFFNKNILCFHLCKWQCSFVESIGPCSEGHGHLSPLHSKWLILYSHRVQMAMVRIWYMSLSVWKLHFRLAIWNE